MDIVRQHFDPIFEERRQGLRTDGHPVPSVDHALAAIRDELREHALAAHLPLRGSLKIEPPAGNSAIVGEGYVELCRRVQDAKQRGIPHGMSLREMHRISHIPLVPRKRLIQPDARVLEEVARNGWVARAIRESNSLPFRITPREVHVATCAPWRDRFHFACETYYACFGKRALKWYLGSESALRASFAHLPLLS
jgi:hypothetical protein